MTTLKETLTNDLKVAMRAGDRPRRDTLRMVLAAIQQIEKDQQTTLDKEQTLALLHKEAKKRQEAIADFSRAGRPAAAESERAELTIIKAYLPTQLTEEAIAARVQAIIDEQGLSGPRAMGTVMKQLMAEFKGEVDGRLANRIVRKLLIP